MQTLQTSKPQSAQIYWNDEWNLAKPLISSNAQTTTK